MEHLPPEDVYREVVYAWKVEPRAAKMLIC
jgi:hypothetical protein